VAVLLFSVAALAGPQTRSTLDVPRQLTAFAVNMNGAATASTNTATVEITINHWTPEASRTQLIQTLEQKGSDALLEALQREPAVGRIRTPDSLGYDLHYADVTPGKDGGQRVVIATDRPIGYWEATNRPRSIDYPFTVIEVHLKDGIGEGKMSLATKITAVGDTIALENYTEQPVQLRSVRVEQK
jgi:hypothetical protein